VIETSFTRLSGKFSALRRQVKTPVPYWCERSSFLAQRKIFPQIRAKQGFKHTHALSHNIVYEGRLVIMDGKKNAGSGGNSNSGHSANSNSNANSKDSSSKKVEFANELDMDAEGKKGANSATNCR